MLELRVAGLLVLAGYLFAVDAAILAKFDINIAGVFGYHTAGQSSPLRVAHMLLFALVCGSATVAVQRVVFPWLETRLLALGTLALTVGIILRQQRLRRVLARVSLGGLNVERRLGDILVSDALVSMANVLVDIAFAISLTWYQIPASEPSDRPGLIGPKTLLVASIPSGIRVKQCVLDFRRTRDKTHLLNLVKYLVGNMPHALRVQIAPLSSDNPAQKELRMTLLQWLQVSLFANAAYSLAWDILVDWRLGRLRTGAPMRFPRWSYISAGIIDTILRFAFIASSPSEVRIITLQALELLRRGMWVVFRVESEPMELSDSIEMQTN